MTKKRFTTVQILQGLRSTADGEVLDVALEAADEIERLQRRETEAAILFAPLAEHDQAVREWLEETP